MRLYSEESFVVNFHVQTDIVTVKANQTFAEILTAFTICTWFFATTSDHKFLKRTIVSYLPEDASTDGVYLTLLPKYLIYSVNNDLVIGMVAVSL